MPQTSFCKFTTYIHLYDKLLSLILSLSCTPHAVVCVVGRQGEDLMGTVPKLQRMYNPGLNVFSEWTAACLIPMLMR